MPQGTVGQRVRARRKDLGLSQGDLAKAAGLTQPTISSLERGESNTSGALASIAHALKVPALWLETGLGDKELPSVADYRRTFSSPPHEEEAPSRSKKAHGKLVDAFDEEVFEVPIVPSNYSCGGNGLNYEPPRILKQASFFARHKVARENVFAVIADGDSMAPFIMNGYAVLFDSSPRTERLSGQVYAMKSSTGDVKIKRVHVRADGSHLLANDNPDKVRYPDEIYPADTKFEWLGRHFYLEG